MLAEMTLNLDTMNYRELEALAYLIVNYSSSDEQLEITVEIDKRIRKMVGRRGAEETCDLVGYFFAEAS